MSSSTSNIKLQVSIEINEKNYTAICSKSENIKKYYGYSRGNPQTPMTANSNAKGGSGITCPAQENEQQCFTNVDTSLPLYPIQGYIDSNDLQNTYTYLSKQGSVPLSDFEIPKNSFNRGWDDITGKDTITYNCPLCTGPKGSIQSYTYTGGSMSWDNCYANLVQYCLGDRTGQTSNKVMNVTCNGNQCENWWPPRESGYTPMGMTYDAKLSCVIMDGNAIEHLTTLCIYGEPTFTYNNYNIKDYSKKPDMISNNYSPPLEIEGYAYYNYGLFKNPLIDLKLSSNPGPTSINETFDNPTCSKSFTYTLPNESYAVYTLNYSFSPSDISSNSNFIFQLYDFLYLMNYLFNTFTSDFKNSCFWVNSVESINELILYYCNQSGNMSETICSKEFLPFDFLPESPCIVNPSNCLTGKNKYCSSSKNFNNNYCLNYYSNYYNGNQLDATIISNLQNNCKEVYNSSSDPSTLPDSFWNTCGCFLPDNVYTEFLENNNVDFSESTLGNRQCWYLPCINSSVLPSNNPKCPDNNIVNCIQYSYITTENTNTLAEKTTETKKTLQHCNSLHSENVETTTSKENFTSFQKNKSWMYLSISFLIILILSILFCSCSL